MTTLQAAPSLYTMNIMDKMMSMAMFGKVAGAAQKFEV
jgi:hypothetical protein